VKILDFNASSALRSGRRSDIRLASIAVAVLGCISHPAFPQTFPDTSSLTPQGEDFQPITPKAPAILPQAPDPLPKATPADTTPIPVKTLHVTGATVFPAATLEALVADQAGGTRTLGELQAAALRITAYYRAAGYFLARAYLPPTTDERRRGDDRRARRPPVGSRTRQCLEALRSDGARAARRPHRAGAPLQQGAPTDRALLLLSDLPGVGGVDSRLDAGRQRRRDERSSRACRRRRESPAGSKPTTTASKTAGATAMASPSTPAACSATASASRRACWATIMGEMAYGHLGAQVPLGVRRADAGFRAVAHAVFARRHFRQPERRRLAEQRRSDAALSAILRTASASTSHVPGRTRTAQDVRRDRCVRFGRQSSTPPSAR
jgi:hypothetical protein